MSEGLPRTLVVDASILFSFFKEDSSRRRIIEELPRLGCRLVTPEFAFKELLSDKGKIMKYAGIKELTFKFLFSLLEKKLDSFPEEEYEEFLARANKISPHGEGTNPESTKDDPYFALALSMSCPIWSDDEDFKKQSEVEVFETEELVEELEL